MTTVALIGDSIRMGYQARVVSALAGIAEVWGPAENGSNTVNLLNYWHHWVVNRKPQVLHVNAGLHDLKTAPFNSRDNLVPPEHYRQNVDRLLWMSLGVSRKVIWATTTPVDDAKHNAEHAKWMDFCRHNEDVLLYNRIAREVCDKHGVEVSDLFSEISASELETLQKSDGVHFTPAGYDRLGDRVAAAVRAAIASMEK